MCGDTTCLVIFMKFVFRSIGLSTLHLYTSEIVGFDSTLELSGIRCIVRVVKLQTKYNNELIWVTSMVAK
jgi:hypothetical protein